MSKNENRNALDILVEEAAHVQPRPGRAWKSNICMAAILGDWNEASSYDETHHNWFCIPLSEDGDTALHIAVSMEQTHFVKELVKRMSMQDMEILKADGNTAFCMAAISGNVELAAVLLNKNPGLVWIRGHKDMLPIQLASSAGHPHMVNFLFEKIRDDMDTQLSFQDIVRLFFLALTNHIYIVASIMLDKYPALASAKDYKELTALEVLAQLSFDRDAPGYRDILSSLFKLMKEEEFPDFARISKAMFDATKSGNDMIVESIFRYKPNMLMRLNSKGQSLLHIAILHRQVNVYRLLMRKGTYKNAMIQVVDCEGNNVLHLAAKLAAEGRFGSPIHQVLICSEELWFKEVKKIVPPALKSTKNAQGWTPQELFYTEHKELSEKAVSELNEMANNFLVVTTLIVSLGITGLLTLRTNPIEGKTPIFKQKTLYIICLLSVSFGISLSAVSMLLFTSVLLPTIWKSKRGYVTSRLIRIICGFLLLYVAAGVGGTITAISGTFLVYNFFPKWIFLAIGFVAGTPLVLYLMTYDYFAQLSLYIIKAFRVKEAIRMLSRMETAWALF